MNMDGRVLIAAITVLSVVHTKEDPIALDSRAILPCPPVDCTCVFQKL